MKNLKIIIFILLTCVLAVLSFLSGSFIMQINSPDKNSSSSVEKSSITHLDSGLSEDEEQTIKGENDSSDKATTSQSDKKFSETKESFTAEYYEKLFSEYFDDFGGDLTYSLHIYSDGIRVASESHPQKSASVIKLFIMDYAYSLIAKGEIKKDDIINGKTLSSLIESMITVSDNSATNTLIDHFTMDKINAYIKANGYSDTVLQRRMLDTAAASRGEENYTSAKDVMAFLDNLYAKKNVFPQNEMLDIMKRQTVSTKLRRNMPNGVVMASKTGELSDTENDVAIVFSSGGDYAIVCLTNGGYPANARDAMAGICRKIYDTLQE